MNTRLPGNNRSANVASVLLAALLAAANVASAQDGSDFRDVDHADDKPNPNSDFREVTCDDCDYDDSSEDEKPKPKMREEDWKYDDVFAEEPDSESIGDNAHDPERDEYDSGAAAGQYYEGDGTGSSHTGAGGAGVEAEYPQGWHDCPHIKGRCYTLPDSHDKEEAEDEDTTYETEPDTNSYPDQGYVPNPYDANRPRAGHSSVPSPYATGGGGNAFGSGQSPYSNAGGAYGTPFNNNAATADPNAVTADCQRSLQAAGNAMTSCAQPNAQQGICAISRQLVSCSERFIQQVSASSCPASVKRSNIDGVRSLMDQARSNASRVCTNF